MSESNSWYDVVTSGSKQLLQGDLVFDCSVAVPLEYPNEKNTPAQRKIFDVIVLSQSCDLENSKVVFAVVCPFFELSTFMETHATLFKDPSTNRFLGRDAQPGFHALNPVSISGMEHDFLIVDFHNTFSVPVKQLRDQVSAMTTPRLRLCSPYRERLAQAFANYYMRVALPTQLYKPLGSATRPPNG